MKFSIITLFPEIFSLILNSSILGRAQQKNKVEFEFISLREFGQGKHQQVDDKPYGGGVGMILKADVLLKAYTSITNRKISTQKSYTILMSASGTKFTQSKARVFSKLNHLIIVCGHYEGVDQRFAEHFVNEEISIGDYVLTGGEIPAMVCIDAITRLIPGVLKKEEAIKDESFEQNLLEYPQYTRPEVFKGVRIPDVLLSGNHQEIARWRYKKSVEKTKKIRPDLIIQTG